MTALTCWTAADLETQPYVREAGPGRVEVTMLVGVWSEVTFAIDLEVQAEVSVDIAASGDGALVPASAIHCTQLTLDELAKRDADANDPDRAHDWLESTRHLGDIRLHLAQQAANAALKPGELPDLRYPRTRFFEVVIDDLPAGQLLRFVATAVIPHTAVRASSQPAGVWLSAPAFAVTDVVGTHTLPGELCDDQWWVLMHQQTDGLDQLRLDMLSTRNLSRRPPPASNLPPVSVALDGATFDVTHPPTLATGPFDPSFVGVRVDRSTDSILLTRRAQNMPLPEVTVTTRTDNSQPDVAPAVKLAEAARNFEPVSVMLIAYAIQGLNDLFAEPLAAYQPPRSFAEVAYSDEDARFSGRPETQENAVGDGYRFVLTAQRHYGIKAVWVFNAGALLLLRHSLKPKCFKELTDAVHDGLISLGNAGVGGHRNSVYQAQTNVEEIARADRLIRRIFSRPGSPVVPDKIYFPDSRIYQSRKSEIESYATLQADGMVDYIVLDRSTVAHQPTGQPKEELYFGNDTPQRDDGNYLWSDTTTKLNLLLIEDRLRDQLVGGSDDEVPRGQLEYHLRRLFMQALHQDRDPDQRRKLFCFGDDIDHLAGNGWFDGNYRDRKSYSNAFLAALCWFQTHPWLQVLTVDEPGFRERFLRRDRELTVSSAIDPSMDPGGAASTRNEKDPPIHFNAWYDAWAETSSPWLGVTLGTLSDDLEQRLIDWPDEHRNELYDIAWTYFLSCTHESMWSKEPVDPNPKPNPLNSPFRWEPEDFVISESLQLRNAWVYLNASVWASWATGQPAHGNYVLALDSLADPRTAGPLLEQLRAAHGADTWWSQVPGEGSGLYWDHDNLSNVILYNAEVLAVLDRNGGRVTQLFCLVDGRPVSVSGTNKAYQFLEVGPPQVACDGQRVQNTVFTPNHRYLASDVLQAAPRPGSYHDQRNLTGPNPTWLPDNFNTYDCTARIRRGRALVECRYEQTPPDQLPADDILAWDDVALQCKEDLRRLRAGQPGVVWHDSPAFAKTIELDGRRLRIRYKETEPGHLVANEFAVDLADLLRGGDPGTRLVRGRTARVTSASKLRVTVKLGRGCDFTAATQAKDDSPDSRALTEDVQIIATGTGGFDYTIELPG